MRNSATRAASPRRSSPQGRKIDLSLVEATHECQRRLRLRVAPAAVPGVQYEFVRDVLLREWLVGAAAHVRLGFLDHAAIVERRPDVAGGDFWVGVFRGGP